MTPEERAGLRPSGYWWQTIEPNHCNHGSWSPCPLVGHTDAPLYTLDPAVLAELLRERDEAVKTLRAIAAEDWRGYRSTACSMAHEALAALGEVPK